MKRSQSNKLGETNGHLVEYFKKRILPYILKTDINYPSGESTDGRTAYVIGFVPIGDYLDPIFFLAPSNKEYILADKGEMLSKFPVIEFHSYPDMNIKWWNAEAAESYVRKAIAPSTTQSP